MEPYHTEAFFSPTTRSSTSGIKFSPRLSMQRYVTVLQVIKDFHRRRMITNVTEFGCGSFVFFDNYLVRCEFINHVNQIDINKDRLAGALHMIETNQFHKLCETERQPLKVDIFEGNVSQMDKRVQNSDIVVAIEVIEHLFENDFNAFPANIFGFIRPKLVVMTTPNYDYNVLFDNGGKFRDEDHKFEFTKKQFIQWGNDIISRYPEYSVKVFGIGAIPEGCPKEIGYCSQMAIFERKEISDSHYAVDIDVQEYVLIGSYAYFTIVDNSTEEEKLWQQIDRLIINYSVEEEDLLYVDNDACSWGYRFVCLRLNLLTENGKLKHLNEKDLIALILKFGRSYSIRCFEQYGNLLVVTDECEQNCGSECRRF